MAKKYVPDGACLVCNKGVGFGRLKVTNHKNVSIYGDKSATEGDKVTNLNIPSLGICSITRSACKPVPTRWSGAQQGVTIGPYRKLLEDSKLGCAIGGQISIYFSVPSALMAIRHNVGEEAGKKAQGLGARIDDWFKHKFDQQEKANNLLPDATARNFSLGMVEGVYGGVKGIGEGLLFIKKMRDQAVDAGVHAITHPVETAGRVKSAAVATKNVASSAVSWVSNTDNLKNAAASVGEAEAKAYNWVTTPGNVQNAATTALNNTADQLSAARDWASQQSARDWGKYTGRGVFEGGLMVTGVGEAKAVVSGAEAANVAAKVGEGANVASKVAEGANVAGKTAEAANVTQKAAEGANVAGKAAETRTLGEVVSKEAKKAVPKRPTWRQSEIDAGKDYPGYSSQKSFKGEKEVPYGTKGSTRPDLYTDGHSIEVKNYNVESVAGQSRLKKELVRQYEDRVNNLPAGTRQSAIIDVRGQSVSPKVLKDLKNNIQTEAKDLEIIFMSN